MSKKQLPTSGGFTILELLIVIAVLALVIPAIFSLFFITMQSQRKVLVLQEVKRNGDSALSTIESRIKREAVSIHSASPPDSTNEVCDVVEDYTGTLFFKDRNDSWFSYSSDDLAIVSTIPAGSSNLTNDDVDINGFVIDCSRTALFSAPTVTVSFTVTQTNPSARQEDSATLDYKARVKMRTY